MRLAALLLSTGLLAAACSSDAEPRPGDATPTGPSSASATVTEGTSPTPSADPSATPSQTPEPEPVPRVRAGDLRVATAVDAVDFLAGEVGPRPGHTRAYFRAAAWAEDELTAYGWTVERQRFPTPAGFSWSAPVEAGPSVNLVASRGDVRPGEPWLLVGAHLDTVPRSPGAEDNASGVGVVLAVAEALAERRSRLPVVLVLFGSEEPRGEGEDDHHYGSRHYVDQLTPAQRRSLRAMISLDRVGVGSVVPVQTIAEANAISDQLEAAARDVGAPTVLQTDEVASDHESFHDAGLPAARLGSTPYAGYHDPSDLPGVVERDQLGRVGRIVLAWLR